MMLPARDVPPEEDETMDAGRAADADADDHVVVATADAGVVASERLRVALQDYRAFWSTMTQLPQSA